MTQNKTITASCLCKAVEFETNSMSKNVGACHCNTCRKWSGGPLLAVDCGENGIKFKDETNVSVFDSSDWADRGFCAKCGTHLFYRLKQTNLYIVPAGLFEGSDAEFNFDHQVFIDEKPTYYDFSNQTENMTGEEVFAKFMGGEEE